MDITQMVECSAMCDLAVFVLVNEEKSLQNSSVNKCH